MAQSYRGPDGRFVSKRYWDNGVKLLVDSTTDPAAIMRDLSRQVDGQLQKRLMRYARAMKRNLSMYQGVEEANRRVSKVAQSDVLRA